LLDDDGAQVFLHAVREDSAGAEVYYKQALAADPTHANNLSNFGLFLSDVQRDPGGAETCYLAALEADPNHANAAYNYAVLLDGALKRHADANAMYRRVLAADPNHAYALYNLAVLLEEKLPHAPWRPTTAAAAAGSSDEAEVLRLYERACMAAPEDALSCADLGRFLLVRRRSYGDAEAALAHALVLDPCSTVALFHLGLLKADRSKADPHSPSSPERDGDLAAAALLWHKLAVADPRHVAGLRRLARLEAQHLKDWHAADRHYTQVSYECDAPPLMLSLVRVSWGTCPQGATRCVAQAVKAAYAARASGSATGAEDLEGLLREVVAVMAKAPAKCDQATRAVADKGTGRLR
jgi:tetratricopeptide (TPR) repeat protein